MKIKRYKPTPTAKKFHKSNDQVRLLCGPLGSGKTYAAVMEIYLRALQQRPDRYNVRNFACLVVRQTSQQLKDTTLRTFFQIFPEYGPGITYEKSQMLYTYERRLHDNTTLKMRVYFRSLKDDLSVSRVLSMNVTAAFVNEARELSSDAFDAIQARCGRYPEKRYLKWSGIFADTNPMTTSHWMYKRFVEDKTPDHKIFLSPSGLSSKAENMDNLPDDYYERLSHGKSPAWVNVYVKGRYGSPTDNPPVFSSFNTDKHVIKPDQIPSGGEHYVGVAWGLPNIAVVVKLHNDKIYVVNSVETFGEPLSVFCKKLNTIVPKGTKVIVPEDAKYDAFYSRAVGLDLKAVKSVHNDIRLLHTKFDELLESNSILISKDQQDFIDALQGGYCYAKPRVFDRSFKDEPLDNASNRYMQALLNAVQGHSVFSDGKHLELLFKPDLNLGWKEDDSYVY